MDHIHSVQFQGGSLYKMPKLLRALFPHFIFLPSISCFFPLLFWCSIFPLFHLFFSFPSDTGKGLPQRPRSWGHLFTRRTRRSPGLASHHPVVDPQPCTSERRKLNSASLLTDSFLSLLSPPSCRLPDVLSNSLSPGQARWLLSSHFPTKSNKEGGYLHKSCRSLAW